MINSRCQYVFLVYQNVTLIANCKVIHVATVLFFLTDFTGALCILEGDCLPQDLAAAIHQHMRVNLPVTRIYRTHPLKKSQLLYYLLDLSDALRWVKSCSRLVVRIVLCSLSGTKVGLDSSYLLWQYRWPTGLTGKLKVNKNYEPPVSRLTLPPLIICKWSSPGIQTHLHFRKCQTIFISPSPKEETTFRISLTDAHGYLVEKNKNLHST